jgi:hypothetical protein
VNLQRKSKALHTDFRNFASLSCCWLDLGTRSSAPPIFFPIFFIFSTCVYPLFCPTCAKFKDEHAHQDVCVCVCVCVCARARARACLSRSPPPPNVCVCISVGMDACSHRRVKKLNPPLPPLPPLPKEKHLNLILNVHVAKIQTPLPPMKDNPSKK